MKLKLSNILFILMFGLLIFPVRVNALYASFSASGQTVTVGENVTVTLRLNSIDSGRVVAVGGRIEYDSNYLDMIGCSGHMNYQTGNHKFGYLDTSGSGMTSGEVGTCTFRTKAVGNTSVSFALEGSDADNNDLTCSGASAGITIKTPPSSNNNLSSLNVNPGGINFNGGTSYSTSVGANVTSVNVTASLEDNKSSLSGVGTHNLNYGSNTINVTVTAENGSRKVYTIVVNRKDDRSSNNNLSSLNVSNGELKPGFSKNTTSYNMEVPYEVSKLKINANAEDSKSKVSISNPDLVAEETTQVKVIVTAENGSSKTYVINVKRGKDPNKKLSNNNYLSNLTASVGMLSPAFNKEKTNYAIYLPYEVSNISFDLGVEDTKYATIKKEENNSLGIGSNVFKYTVTAEDGTTREYTITVIRNDTLDKDGEITGTNVFLKKLSLNGAKLVKTFDKKSNVLYYKKTGKKVDIKEAIPEVKDNNVSVTKLDDAFIITVEAPTGARGYYLLIEQTGFDWIKVIVFSLIALFVGLGLAYLYLKKKKNNNKPEKKEKSKKIKKKAQIN